MKRRLVRILAALWEWVRPSRVGEEPSRMKVPKPGYEYNPLWRERNMQCLCGSGLKAKRCCGQFVAVPREVAGKLRAAIDWEKKTK